MRLLLQLQGSLLRFPVLIRSGVMRLRSWWRQETNLSGLQRRRARWGLLFISPWIIGFLLFKVFPIATSLLLSLTNFVVLHREDVHFIGLGNYLRVIADGNVWSAFFANLYVIVVGIPIQICCSIFFASLLANPRLKARGLFRILFFLPCIIPGAALIQILSGFFDSYNGWWNILVLKPLGMPTINGAFSPAGREMYMWFMILWSVGPGFLIILNAMQSIPQEYYEAARVDGAGPMSRFINVTLPMISPAIFFSLIINLLAAFGGLSLIDFGTGGAAGLSAIDQYVYGIMFRDFELGYAVSIAWLFFIFTMAITIFLFRTSSRWVYFAGGEDVL